MIDRLMRFDAIAWDFDGTLIEHPRSSLFHRFIIETPDKRHAILTFRTHGMQNSMFREMRRMYPQSPGPECFFARRNIADRAWEEFNKVDQLRLFNHQKGPLTPWEVYYREWKGLTCRELALPVLVDDRPDQVLLGCEKFGIAFVHPDEL